MRPPASRLTCWGCGAVPDPAEAYPFRCPHAGAGDVDHVLVRVLDPDRVRFPEGGVGTRSPFVHYRGLLHSHHRAIAGGVADDEVVEIVTRLDDAVSTVAGDGFRATPFGRNDVLSDRLGFSAAGGVWVKDETGNVSGSHKGRHLMGVLLHLEVAERLGLADPGARPDLAIASCGNAALAAAVVARPQHPYTKALLAAVPEPDPANRLHERPVIQGEPPNPSHVPGGCAFHPRCPAVLVGCCAAKRPGLIEVEPDHWVACFLYA